MSIDDLGPIASMAGEPHPLQQQAAYLATVQSKLAPAIQQSIDETNELLIRLHEENDRPFLGP